MDSMHNHFRIQATATAKSCIIDMLFIYLICFYYLFIYLFYQLKNIFFIFCNQIYNIFTYNLNVLFI